jgi:hypothetical protein
MTRRRERPLLIGTPAVALATVALGLRIGAGSAVRAAIVIGAPVSGAGTGRAWQVVVFDEDHGVREPVPHIELEVIARGDGRQAEWRGTTSDDGVAEVLLPLMASGVHLEVRAGARAASSLLASGDLQPANDPNEGPARSKRADPNENELPARSTWSRFARREGPVLLDVAVLGQRVATGFPADLWIRASDAASGTALAGVDIEPERDSSFVPAASHVTTDARGWAHLVATPVGHAVAVVLRAKAADGRAGEWAGALYVSPGAAQLAVDERVSPEDGPVIDVVVPTLRTTAYVEIDDTQGRAWATAAPVVPPASGASVASLPHATARAPRLAPGLYWAVEAGDPAGAAKLGSGTIARPFFVAASDDAALSMGTAALGCTPVADPREARRALSACLALAAPTPVPRWTALDGFAATRARDAEKRRRGLGLALGAVVVAVALEVVLLLRAFAVSRARLERAAQGEELPRRLVGRVWTVGIAVLVAVMGFVLLAAFLVRVG